MGITRLPRVPDMRRRRRRPALHKRRTTRPQGNARIVAVVRAAVLGSFDGPDAVVLTEVPEPAPAPADVLIDVSYAGVVFPDVLCSRGEYQVRPELPFVPGWELSGVVRTDSGGFCSGDRVAALPMKGGFAETAAVNHRLVFPLPASVTLETAAALPLNYLTMHFALRRRARLLPGETVLVHGAAGGVGSAACQLAAAYGARVIAVVSTEAKRRIAEQAGADEVVPVDGFREATRELTAGRGVDVVVDPVGGDRFLDSLRCLAREGRILVLGFTGRGIPTVKVNRLLLTNTTVMGVGIREFWADEPDYPARQWAELSPLLEAGTLDPPLDITLDLEDAAAALHRLDGRRAAGRVVLRTGR